MFFAQARRLGDAPLLWRKTGGKWQSTSWDEAAQTIASLATALTAEGIMPGDRVVIVSESRPEFFLWDMAIMAAGAVSVPTYITNTARDHAHILENSGAVAAVVSTQKLARVLLEAVYQAPNCRLVIGMEPLRVGQTAGDVRLADMPALLSAHPADVDRIAAAATMPREQLACLIYTSGTGGTPRGVMQHHGAILHNVAACMDIIVHDFPESPEREAFLSFLPPSHAYEHTAGQMLPVAAGGQIYYAEGLEKLVVNITEVRPTIMVVVPRLFEVMRQRIVKQIEKQGGLAPRLLDLALRLERIRQEKGRVGLVNLPADFIVERLLRRRIRERFGGRMKALVSGGAPLNPEVGLFFQAAGLTLLQGYGQTEAGPVISCNRPAAGIRMDSVGPPLRDVEVAIAEDGEILVAGELVMMGYWNNPVETARALQGGWLHTGDIGILDEDGHLVITDRKKDIIVNDKGDTISPQRVEGMLTLQPEIMQAIVYGDRRPYLVGLLVPDADFMQQWAAEQGRDIHNLHQDLDFQRAMQTAVDRVNAQLSITQKVRRIMLADHPFTVENGQMTPSLKPRRHILNEVYGARLDALYR
ncbi:MAG: AMP-dependent synthetase/ligase [Sphingomonadaceae bacterium]